MPQLVFLLGEERTCGVGVAVLGHPARSWLRVLFQLHNGGASSAKESENRANRSEYFART